MSKKKNETALQVYVNEHFGKIRAMMIDGVPYFVGKDVAEALGYKKARNAIENHVDKEDALKWGVPTNSGKQEMTLINESGLYTLALKSQLESAKPFRRWVTSEVLPSIRETGAYVNPNFEDDRWSQTRFASKEAAKAMASAIKTFIAHARSQGCDWEDKYFYSQAHIFCNVAVGLPKRDGRDHATNEQLNNIDLLNRRIVSKVLTEGVANKLHYAQIWAQVQVKINEFLKLIGQTPVFLIDSEDFE